MTELIEGEEREKRTEHARGTERKRERQKERR